MNKSSHLVTTSTEVKLTELKKALVREGLYFGYHPLDETSFTLGHYLKSRTPNLHYFKYGSLADMVSSLVVTLADGKSFHIKDAPRAAIGPDFNRLVIGSKENFGETSSVTLKVHTLPEKMVSAVIMVNSRDGARDFLRFLLANFLHPLTFYYLPLDQATELCRDLGLTTTASECVIVSLSGLSEIVNIAIEIVNDYGLKKKTLFHVCDKKSEQETVHAMLNTQVAYGEIKDQIRTLIWPASEVAEQMEMEKALRAGR